MTRVLLRRTSDVFDPCMNQRGFRRGMEGCYVNVQIMMRCTRKKITKMKEISYASKENL